MKYRAYWLLILSLLCCPSGAAAQQPPVRELWDYVAPMKKVAAKFRGRPGVVLHVGDSITYSNPYGQWARFGQGKTPEDQAALKWMHCGADDETDGWWLCRFDHPGGGRSHTACSGIRADEMLAGGKRGMPSLAGLLDKYKPQMVVLMLGTNDASAGRPLDAYRADMQKCVDLILGRRAVCILSTIPPHPGRGELAASYNNALRDLAKARGLPLIDLEKEILRRRPNDWNGTLLGKGDVHPTASAGGAKPSSAPTAENLRNSGYLLRGWLSVKKIAEVKRAVIDGKPLAPDDSTGAKPQAADAVPLAASQPTANVEKTLRLPITRDTWFSAVGNEADCNTGGSSRLKVKSIQEMSLVDFDPDALRGRVILGATLHVRLAGSEVLHRMTVSSFSSPWVEGTASSYQPQAGSSTFNHARHPDTPWAFHGSDLTAVMLSQGGTIWRMADATPPDANRWQQVPVDPLVIAARVAGIGEGLLVFDDTGSEWTRQGEKFNYRVFPNRFFHSRQSGEANAPYLTIALGGADKQPPAAPKKLISRTEGFPLGEAWLWWDTPADAGPAGTLGFLVDVEGRRLPQYLVPPACEPGKMVAMRLTDLDPATAARGAGSGVRVSIRAVDAAGNVGSPLSQAVRLSSKRAEPLPGQTPKPFRGAAPLPKLAGAEVAVLDPLDKVHPVSGAMIPKQPDEYLSANHLWSAEKKQVRLAAAGGEFVAFQIAFRGPARGVQPSLSFGPGSPIRAEFSEYRYVNSKQGPLPDPIVPLSTSPEDIGGGTRPRTKRANADGPGAGAPSYGSAFNVPGGKVAGQRHGSLLCEVYVPHEAKAGAHSGKLTLRAGGRALELDVPLWVWSFQLPDYLSFLPEMNCYGLPAGERDYYRLAHKHRTVINRVPYSQSGHIDDGCAPVWDGRRLDFAAWDRRFGQYFDGSAFDDLPRRGVPIEIFYLPLHENWPSTMEGNYNGDYWADRAFKPGYREAFVSVSQQMAEHFRDKGWSATIFQCYLNNKNNFKRNGWSRGSSPWLLDEPANFQDYWALRYFGEAFHEGVGRAGNAATKAKLMYRCDISRPEWQRNSLDHVLDYNVVGGRAFQKYHRIVYDRKRLFGQVVMPYGTTNAIETSNMQPVGWSLDSWTRGGDGVLPWQTIGRDNSWQQADQLSIFYPGAPAGQKGPVPSIRLKAYRRGQQDVEYLVLLAKATGEPRWAVGQSVRKVLKLAGRHGGTGFTGGEDAGTTRYADLLPQDAWALRIRVAQELSKRKPKPSRWVVNLRTPPRDPAAGAPAYVKGYVPDAGTVARPTPPVKPPSSPAKAKALQGRAFVRDTIIDPEFPDKNFGSTQRDNRVKRRNDCNAMLIRFDLDKLDLAPGAKPKKATLSFYVWDPSSKGNAKIMAFPLTTAWDEGTATWQKPANGKQWKGGDSFAFGKDTGRPSPHIVVPPERGGDTADPPLEYQLDVTEMVRDWLTGKSPNHGMAIAPQVDRKIDDGQYSRMQILGSEYGRKQYTPKLTVE